MDFLDYSKVSFGSGVDMGLLCETLDRVAGASIWYDIFAARNTRWFWIVEDIIAAINNDKALCGLFGLYPTYVAGILSEVQEINFYILSHNKLKGIDYFEKCVPGKQCVVSSKLGDENCFTKGEENVITFEIRIMDGNLPSELTFAYSIINSMRLSCLPYGIV
jgi:hypothetical protein